MKENKKRQKALFILHSLEAGGAEKVIITLLNNLNREKFEPIFLSVSLDGPMANSIDKSIPIHKIEQKLTIFSFITLLRKLRKINPDIIVSTMAPLNFAVLALKSFLPNTKIIVREAITPSFFFVKYHKIKWVLKFLYKKLYSKADIILSPTQKVFDEFSLYLRKDFKQGIVIKNPVNVKEIRHSVKPSDFSSNHKDMVYFVACGRLNKQKGFDRLIQSLSCFNSPCHWKLDIIGEGPERTNLEDLIKKFGLQDNVFLKGLMLPPYSHLAQADCFLMPSHFEGLPNIVLESLACGTAVIATQESGGIDEIAKDCADGCVTIVKDMDDFLKEMEKTISQNKKKLAPSLLADCYHEEKVIYHFEKILNKIT